MSLTKSDLTKIKRIINEGLASNNLKLLEILVTKDEFDETLSERSSKSATKKDFMNLQDSVTEIKNKLDTEYSFIQKRGETNSMNIEAVRKDIERLKRSRKLCSN
ncbi:MAG: hypothetical protein PHS44_01495 [Candidatus Dojkabacteria bacterium]|nr:hypothetical protein [Candidatus Dojkabacteria bacterium]